MVEEPFTTRDAILTILKPGQPATESPFRRLKRIHCASPGLRVEVRTTLGRVLGTAYIYSVLNADAARAVRLGDAELAGKFAERAHELERSAHADVIREAIREVASTMTGDPDFSDAPPSLQRYLRLRGRTTWLGLDRSALAREWLAHSSAWLSRGDRVQMIEAIMALAQAADEARADLQRKIAPPTTTFFGIVRRMDELASEIQGETEMRLLPRETLEREGLAVIGQPVALLCETLPAGGSLVLAMPAVAVEDRSTTTATSPWDIGELDEGHGIPASMLDPDDEAWFERELAREPTAVPLAPLRRG